jgi:hypothetical protein
VWSWNFICWAIFKGWTTFCNTIFIKMPKYEREGRLKITFHILFMDTTHEPLHLLLDKRSFGNWNIIDVRAIYMWIANLFEMLLNVAMLRHLVLMLSLTLNHSVYNYAIFCSVIFCKLFIRFLNNARKVDGLMLLGTSCYSICVGDYTFILM